MVDFARGLQEWGVEILSTGGTGKMLREAEIPVKDVAEVTGFPEMLDGRVKTLHPAVHGGILARRNNETHRRMLEQAKIGWIDMVVVNLYAFEQVAARPSAKFSDLIENVDIGGPAMIRSAAKNFQDVAVLTSPEDYSRILDEMKRYFGTVEPGDALEPGPEGLRLHGAIRHRNRRHAGLGGVYRARDGDTPAGNVS